MTYNNKIALERCRVRLFAFHKNLNVNNHVPQIALLLSPVKFCFSVKMHKHMKFGLGTHCLILKILICNLYCLHCFVQLWFWDSKYHCLGRIAKHSWSMMHILCYVFLKTVNLFWVTHTFSLRYGALNLNWHCYDFNDMCVFILNDIIHTH